MEPGHEDREYVTTSTQAGKIMEASMEPGHEDREYPGPPVRPPARATCLNGARS